jgi:hypothetical protein
VEQQQKANQLLGKHPWAISEYDKESSKYMNQIT